MTAAAIVTGGNLSDGVFAQSVGGGGGNGGSSFANAAGGNYSGAISLGGSGGVGGNSSSVTVKSSNAISTAGDQSSGIFAQSVGGGGGNGGASSSSATSGGSAALTFGLGGSGGGGGTSGTVTVLNNAQIATLGANSAGIFAQSVGGGGGNGGASVSAASAAPASSGTSTTTSASTGATPKNGSGESTSGKSSASAGKDSAGPSGESGADGGYAAGLSIGGAGGAGSGGGAVTVSNGSNITTGTATGSSGVNSPAIFAQSVGGGGGNAGSSSSNANAGKASVALSLGGNGGGAGPGGTVLVGENGGSLMTYAANSTALFAQSVGGGGGNGGSSSSTTGAGGSASVALGLGGSGAGGGSGGLVVVCSTATSNGSCDGYANGPGIRTFGDGSFGIFGQSIGGGGGNGGAFSAAATAGSASGDGSASGGPLASSASTPSGVALAMGLGGSGGGGGNGGAVYVWNNEAVITQGAQAVAIAAQSVGGGGGTGGSNTVNANSGSYTVSLGLGGSGGTGGVGGTVGLSNTGAVATSGAGAYGLLAQSVGGGGGSAGASSATTANGGDASVTISVGGSAGSGQNGGGVTITSAAPIQTSGAGALGIVAQSIGGGGGIAGSSRSSASGGTDTANLSLGGTGNSAGTGGQVAVTYYQPLTTLGANASAILAQSISGGGGIGSTVDSSAIGSGGINVTLYPSHQSTGRSGGDTASAVSVTNAGQGTSIATAGANSSGIVAQSVGGGGGLTTFAATSALYAGATVSTTFFLGDNGGADGGGTVAVNLAGAAGGLSSIATSGANSFGVLAQSVGGGGGVTSFSVAPGNYSAAVVATIGQNGQSGGTGNSSPVTVTGSPYISTTGYQSVGVLAQSVGGGGGVALASFGATGIFRGDTFRVGAGNGNGLPTSENVTVTFPSGAIATTGALSLGIVAQSIAGGGGFTEVRSSRVTLGDATDLYTGAVQVNNSTTISTSGAASVGILAQSIGGGGGLAVAAGTATLGGSPAGGGNGGKVTVTSNGAISTSGVNAIGILAQSVGGGGGAVLSTGDAVTANFLKGNGNAGAVTVTVNAPITTTGAGAYGVIAQSVSNGGGLVQNGAGVIFGGGGSTGGGRSGGGTDGGVTVTANASITTTGSGSKAVYLYSTSDPTLNVNPGVVITGGAGGSAVVFDAPTNTLNNSGELATADGANGMVITSLSGDTAVNNGGILQGNVQLAAGANNLLHNLQGGTILAGSLLDLGGTGTLQNDGVLASGAVPGATRINGSLAQSASGILRLRINQATGASDSFAVSGSAQLAGNLLPVILDAGHLKAGAMQTEALTASGGLTLSDFAIGSAPSAILSYRLSSSGGSLLLGTNVDFAPAGLSGAGWALGGAIAAIQAQGSSPLFEMLVSRLAEAPTVAALDQAYQSLSGGAITEMPTATLQASFMALDLVADHLDAWQAGRDGAGARSGLGGPAPTVHVWAAPLANTASGSGITGEAYGEVAGIDAALEAGRILVGASINNAQSVFSVSTPNANGSVSSTRLQPLRRRAGRRRLSLGDRISRLGRSHFRAELFRDGPPVGRLARLSRHDPGGPVRGRISHRVVGRQGRGDPVHRGSAGATLARRRDGRFWHPWSRPEHRLGANPRIADLSGNPA